MGSLLAILALAMGWWAGGDVEYTIESPSSLFPLFVAIDRLLLGWIICSEGTARNLIYLRELLVGVNGLRVSEVNGVAGGNEGVAAASAASSATTPHTSTTAASRMASVNRAGAATWMVRALKLVDTATRVNMRLKGHIAREIIQEHLLQPRVITTATAASSSSSSTAQTPVTSLVNMLTTLSPRPVPATPMNTARQVIKVTAPWEEDDEEEDVIASLAAETPNEYIGQDESSGPSGEQGGEPSDEQGGKLSIPEPTVPADVDGFLARIATV